jgi:sensor c-di-GMP phosphodiesterase-like protein
MYQGYLYSPPLPPEDFARWVEKHRQQTPAGGSG